jgi:hypothetical protein
MARPSDDQLKQAIASGAQAGAGLREAFTGRKAKKLKARDLKKGNTFATGRAAREAGRAAGRIEVLPGKKLLKKPVKQVVLPKTREA